MLHSSQGRRTSEGTPTSPTSPPAGLPPHLTVGDHTQPGTMAGNESMAIVSMSEVVGQDDWVHLTPEDVPSNIEGAHDRQEVCLCT